MKSPCYITPVGLRYAPAMCYMVSRIGGSFKGSCVEFLLIRGHTRSYASPEGYGILWGREVEGDGYGMDRQTMKELETLQTLMLWREKDAKKEAQKRLHNSKESFMICIDLHEPYYVEDDVCFPVRVCLRHSDCVTWGCFK